MLVSILSEKKHTAAELRWWRSLVKVGWRVTCGFGISSLAVRGPMGAQKPTDSGKMPSGSAKKPRGSVCEKAKGVCEKAKGVCQKVS